MGVDIKRSREMFSEYLEVVRQCWEDKPLNYKGNFVNIENINVIPKPIQKPGPPVYIAVSTSPESVDNAAKLGLPILVGGPTTTLGQTPAVVDLWHERMEHYGHTHENIDLPVSANIYVAPTMEEAEAAGNQARWEAGTVVPDDGPGLPSTGMTLASTMLGERLATRYREITSGDEKKSEPWKYKRKR